MNALHREHEAHILGCFLRWPGTYAPLSDRIQSADFEFEPHRHLFSAIDAVYREGDALDVPAIGMAMGPMLAASGGPGFIRRVIDSTSTQAGLARHVDRLAQRGRLRRFVGTLHQLTGDACQEAAGKDVDGFIASAANTIADVMRQANTRGQGLRPFSVFVDEAEVELRQRVEHGRPPGLRTGIWELDTLLGGLQPGELVIVAARPGQGKSSLALQVARKVGASKRSALFSLEMPGTQLAHRSMAQEANLDLGLLHAGKPTQEALLKAVRACGILRTSRMLVDDAAGLTPSKIRARCLQAHLVEPLSLVVCDYLQIMRPDHRSAVREQQVAEMSRSMKALAKELGCPVMVLAQLNRKVEERTDKRPVLSDLRESGALEQDADIVLFPFRESYYDKPRPSDGDAEIIVAKHRQGAGGTANVFWDGAHTQFISRETQQKGDW
ncbi:MAG: hypothetical protein CMK74_01125 [Pseudomonadales bacterium]|nr:hypothetical protein [Pseudomonadales bacterium]